MTGPVLSTPDWPAGLTSCLLYLSPDRIRWNRLELYRLTDISLCNVPSVRLYRRCEPGDGLETTDRCQPCNYGWYSQSHLTGPACPSLLSGSPHYFCCDTSLSPLLIIIPPPPTSPPALRGTNTTTSFRRRPGTDTGKLCIRGSGKVLKQNAFIHLFMACIQQLKHGLWYEK